MPSIQTLTLDWVIPTVIPLFIERDWYRYDALSGTWNREEDFASYALGIADTAIDLARSPMGALPVTTEARVAGTQFSVSGSCDSDQTLGFVLSGDGEDHGTMATGEFHVFDPADGSIWRSLPPHPGFSRWAPGSFVLQGSSRVYLFGGYDRQNRVAFSDLWTIDLEPLFDEEGFFLRNNGTSSGNAINDVLDQNGVLDPFKQVLDNTIPEAQRAVGLKYLDSSSSASHSRCCRYCGLSLILATSCLALFL